MPRMSKADAAVSLDEPEIEGRYAEMGDYTPTTARPGTCRSCSPGPS